MPVRYIFSLSIYAFIIPLLAFTLYSAKKKEDFSFYLVITSSFCMLTMALYATSLILAEYAIAFVLADFYYASVSWLLFSLVNFMMIFTGIFKKKKTSSIRIALFVFCIADFFIFIFNLKFHNVFSLLQNIDDDGSILSWIANYRWPFYLHLALSYLQVFLIAACLVYKIISSSKIFRIKYEIIFVIFMLIIAVNAIFLTAFPLFDVSILGYAFMDLYLCYSALYSMPKFISSQMLKLISENINQAIVCFDSNGNKIFSNKKSFELYNDKNYASHINKLLDSSLPDNFKNSHVMIMNEQECFFDEEINRVKDSKSRLIGISLNISDNTKIMKKMEKELYVSTHDELTGLYNRRSFFENAAKIIRENKETQFYLIATNIKDFKMINTCFGSDLGDKVLVEQAKMLLRANYPDTICGRISSDNFIMLIPKNYFKSELALKNTQALQALFKDLHYEIKVYIGVYEVSDIYESVSAMYDKAQIAIRSIYGSYDKNIAFYDLSLMERLYEEKNIVTDFAKYIGNGAFEIILKPLFTCDKESVCGAQVISRWNNPVNGVMEEEAFIDLLDKTMLLHKLDLYIWEEAVKILAEWNEKNHNFYLNVKIHQQSFYYLNLIEVFTSFIKKYKIDPSYLVLGISEDCFTRDVKMHVDILNQLHDEGFKIQLDDFGSQFSSLNILKDINADVLKIDFDTFYEEDKSDRTLTIVESIILMSKACGMKVIVECSDFEKQKEFLQKSDCDIFQHTFCNKCLCQKEFEKLYMES